MITGPVILCFGDSNTHGTPPMNGPKDTDRFDAATRWPGVMRSELPHDWTVIEEGLPGRTTVHDDPIEGEHKNGLRSLPVAVESHRPIDLVILMLGTNDLKARLAVTALDIAQAHETLAAVVQAKRGQPGYGKLDLLIVAPPPVREIGPFAEMFLGAEEKAARLSASLEDKAAELAAGFVDAGAHIAVCSEDGIHFDQTAHAVLGAELATAVTARIGQQQEG
jgi:lysophospholipase L1-like esterase